MSQEHLHNKILALEAQIAELRAIQEIHQQEAVAREAIELQLSGVIHSAMDAIITVDEEQSIVIFNAAAEIMFDCVADEAIGTSLTRFIPTRFRDAHHTHLQTFGTTRVTTRRMGALGAIFGIRSNGEEFPIEASISQVLVAGKSLFTVILRDISERRKTERLAELGTLASGMAHEIGTPMNVILGRAEFLMRKTSDENTQKGLATIVMQVERITKIMNQLLSFARKRPVERRSVDLAGIISTVLDVMEERFKVQHIQVETSVAKDLRNVFADPDLISQVLLNLVMNACHAMLGGGVLGIILQNNNKQVHLTLSDTGCGIPSTDLPNLFDPFFTTKPVGEGTGLGLTVAHGIIQEHNGMIQVVSEVGKGATFHIFLPMYQDGM